MFDALVIMLLVAIFGGMGGFAAGIKSPSCNVVIMPLSARRVPLGWLGDIAAGAITGTGVMLVIFTFINLPDSGGEPGQLFYLRICALGTLAGFAGIKLLSDLSDKVTGQVEDMRAKVDAFQTSQSLDEALREAIFLRSEKKYEEALHYYRRALDIESRNEEALIGQAVMTSYIDEPNNYKEAIDALDEAIRLCPNSGRAYYNRACIKHLMSALPGETIYNHDDILDDLQEAIARSPLYRAFARHDQDFGGFKDNERFKTLTAVTGA